MFRSRHRSRLLVPFLFLLVSAALAGCTSSPGGSSATSGVCGVDLTTQAYEGTISVAFKDTATGDNGAHVDVEQASTLTVRLDKNLGTSSTRTAEPTGTVRVNNEEHFYSANSDKVYLNGKETGQGAPATGSTVALILDPVGARGVACGYTLTVTPIVNGTTMSSPGSTVSGGIAILPAQAIGDGARLQGSVKLDEDSEEVANGMAGYAPSSKYMESWEDMNADEPTPQATVTWDLKRVPK